MHKNFPSLYVFLDQYNNLIFENDITNLGVIYRNYESKNKQEELFKIAIACKKRRYKLYVSNDIKLALKVKADGIYIPSFNKTKRFNNLGKKNLKILGSAHNQKEIKNKIKQNCCAIFLAPTFKVQKKNSFIGIYKFNNLARTNNIKFLALGGINEKNFYKLKLLNIFGFGGISMFKKKPAFKRPVFLKNKFF